MNTQHISYTRWNIRQNSYHHAIYNTSVVSLKEISNHYESYKSCKRCAINEMLSTLGVKYGAAPLLVLPSRGYNSQHSFFLHHKLMNIRILCVTSVSYKSPFIFPSDGQFSFLYSQRFYFCFLISFIYYFLTKFDFDISIS